jgi:hypothetical protein
MHDHAAVAASRHCFAASARKIRSVERETRWRWRLKVFVHGGVHAEKALGGTS